MKITRVHVTGVAGLIGSHLARYWCDQGAEVTASDDFTSGYKDNVDPRIVPLAEADCTDLDAMVVALRGCDVVYHCAASPHEGLSVFSPVAITQSVFGSTMSVLTAAIINKVRRFVNFSSMARYGAIDIPFTEDAEPQPEDPYGIAKLAAEKEVELLCRVHDMEYVTAVPHNVVGPGQRYCMARGSLVKLSTGFKPIEKIHPGEEVRVAGRDTKIIDHISLGKRDAIRILMESGQEITVGRDHRFRSFVGEELLWREAKDLMPGETIISEAPRTDIFDRASYNFQFGQLLGLLISDGSYNSTYQADIACCIEEDKPDLRALLTRLGIKWGESERGVFRICSKAFVDRLRALGLHATGENKIIPEQVLNGSHDLVAGVLSGIFSGDGWITRNQNIVAVATISERLMRQVQQLLLSYGMRSKLARREPSDTPHMLAGREIDSTTIWYVTLLSENVENFSSIGFVYSRKQRMLETKKEIKESALFEGLGSRITAIKQFLPKSVRVQRPNALESIRPDITKYSLARLCDLLDDWLESDEAKLAPEYSSFVRSKSLGWRRLVSSGHPMKIASVERCEVELFDISLEDPSDHTYIGDGFVCHNCDPYRNVVAIMINRCLQGKPPIVYGDGMQRRCFSHISDALDCLAKMATEKSVVGEVINIGPDEEFVTINDLAELVIAATGFEGKPEHVPPRPQEVKFAYCSSDKARRMLGYQTRKRLADIVVEMVGWIRTRGPLPFDYYLPLEIVNDKTPKTWLDRLI